MSDPRERLGVQCLCHYCSVLVSHNYLFTQQNLRRKWMQDHMNSRASGGFFLSLAVLDYPCQWYLKLSHFLKS